ncbi:hypothetical protein KVF89_21455 [Nocardioides carbamazepini]|uniref:hypothetical protein n=1 Tax=Nocardioides carbamazepini TaxID=2854259 RepID=UPI002149BA6B|nr:hypothetical protein [Nocardioides carbamazepini]MCR1785120.1 hypothetical protein [Nocardioides carbamazepini]
MVNPHLPARRRPRSVAALVTVLVTAVAGLVIAGPSASPARAAAPVASGKYAGTIVEDGAPSAEEWVRFRVKKGKRIVGFNTRVWLQCYTYPNTYTQLPAVVEMPKAPISRRKVDHAWTQQFTVDGEVETLEGRLQLRFGKGGKVTGQLSVDVANCATRLGEAPYWVPLSARRK